MGLKKKKIAKTQDVEAESGVKVAVGDDIVIDSGSTMPFVAKVQSVLPPAKKKEKGRLKVSWYYFPEDTTGGRQVFHSKCEIFKSNHEDIVSTQSVMNVCKVLQLPQWCKYHAEGDSQRQPHNGPHSTRPFGKAATDAPTKEPATNAKPPGTGQTGAAASAAEREPAPPSPKAAPNKQGKGAAAAKGSGAAANGADHRGKRRLAEQPAGAPAAAARRVGAEPSPPPEPAAAAGRGGKATAAPGTNGSAGRMTAADGAADAEAEAAAEGSDAASEREPSPMVFLCRHAYDAKRHKWVDEEVPLYCVCCMPYNPDLDMVECNRCGEWFHGECLGMNEEQFERACKQDEWTCIACSAKKRTE